MILLAVIWLTLGMAHVLLLATWSSIFRLVIAEVTFGLGPSLFRWGRLTFRLVPLGGSVRYEVGPDQVARSGQPEQLNMAALLKRAGAATMPIATLLAVATIGLGFGAFDYCVAGFRQLWQGAWHPISIAQQLITDSIGFCAMSTLVVSYCAAATKFCVLNVLPLPGSSTGWTLDIVLRAAGMSERQLIALRSL
ncbi:hypothetical protein [Ahniella affigens]|uniref:hypothetical protein n=1 Tax=Ahniella affigens TaxID=2021234 RepID=UPI0011B27CAB|nr:hypothetical protein [Ahniella affigens]